MKRLHPLTSYPYSSNVNNGSTGSLLLVVMGLATIAPSSFSSLQEPHRCRHRLLALPCSRLQSQPIPDEMQMEGGGGGETGNT